ncbi:hypothetical protein ONE63_008175 [Megalurothrips usitatus]|uniref:Uncharacterized protein n=1 Tax=Megalurothrips usitatus TaxID=439358 RepID=A0AAV7XKB6_9NEOP|nr:hypothetical protein ONE63_008175 [Megalurothrips usitatus]
MKAIKSKKSTTVPPQKRKAPRVRRNLAKPYDQPEQHSEPPQIENEDTIMDGVFPLNTNQSYLLTESQNSMLEDLLKSIEIPESQLLLGAVTQTNDNPVPSPKLDKMEEPPYGVCMTPISLTGDFSKKLVLGYDLKTKAPLAYFKGDGKLSGRVRLTIDELFALLKDKTFNTIQNWFSGTHIATAPLNVGGLEVTLYTAYHEQFAEETVQNLTQQGMNYIALVQTDIHSQQAMIKKAMNSTSTHITAMHSQDMLMTLLQSRQLSDFLLKLLHLCLKLSH